jgi:chromosome partitioning protein
MLCYQTGISRTSSIAATTSSASCHQVPRLKLHRPSRVLLVLQYRDVGILTCCSIPVPFFLQKPAYRLFSKKYLTASQYRRTVIFKYLIEQAMLSQTISHTKVIAAANQKGGTAKTTTVIHLGAAIAEMGKKVLLIDLDPQGHLAEGFGIVSDTLPVEMSNVLDGSKHLADIIITDVRPGLDLAPSNIRLADMELTLVNLRFRESKLKRAMEPILPLYDYVMLDCPPSLGLLTVNALIAATHVLIPMAAEYYSMLGVSLLTRTVETITTEANPALAIIGIIPTHFKRTIHAREVIARTTAELGDHIHVFETPINDSTRFPEASAQGKTVFDLAPEIEGAQAYRTIAKEIVHAYTETHHNA